MLPRPMHLVLACAGLLSVAVSCDESYVCSDEIGCVTVAPDAPVKLGVLQALSGSVKPSGERYLRSIEIAVDDRGGSLLDHRIELVTEDSKCTREGGTTAALKLAADPQILGVIGTTCSGAARGASPVLSDAGYTLISGSNTAPSLTAVGGVKGEDYHPGYFRTAHNDADQGRAAAAYAYNALGIRKAATIDDGDAYSRGLAQVFETAFTELGGEITLQTGVNKGDENMGPLLEALNGSGAQLAFMPIFEPEGDRIAQQKAAVPELSEFVLLGADGLLLGTFVETVGTAGVGMNFVGPAKLDTPESKTFEDKYRAKYNQELTTNFHAQYYDAANLLMAAIERVAVKGKNGTLHVGRKALRDALASTKDFKGLTGSLTCSEFGDCGSARFQAVRLDDPGAGIDGLKHNVQFRYP